MLYCDLKVFAFILWSEAFVVSIVQCFLTTDE